MASLVHSLHHHLHVPVGGLAQPGQLGRVDIDIEVIPHIVGKYELGVADLPGDGRSADHKVRLAPSSLWSTSWRCSPASPRPTHWAGKGSWTPCSRRQYLIEVVSYFSCRNAKSLSEAQAILDTDVSPGEWLVDLELIKPRPDTAEVDEVFRGPALVKLEAFLIHSADFSFHLLLAWPIRGLLCWSLGLRNWKWGLAGGWRQSNIFLRTRIFFYNPGNTWKIKIKNDKIHLFSEPQKHLQVGNWLLNTVVTNRLDRDCTNGLQES